ncbi:uncharacterized protein LOC133337562 [Musca vetustissima]|uniref:uncharacterized protein LOC133337562 n=1 Tax=Musca vetustissima TaxID=27455 RepID=UPI002AB6681A|nr:uncharacterized protein LOC133337562 [Musca vetustissima]
MSSNNNRKENVWDRLSRVRKSTSSENLTRSRTNLRSKPSQRFQLMKQMAANHHEQQQQQILYQQKMQHQPPKQQSMAQKESHRRPLTPNSNRSGPGVSRAAKCRLPKPIVMPQMDNRGYFFNNKPTKMLKELMNARSLINSKSSMAMDENRTGAGHSSISIPRKWSTNLLTPPSYTKLSREKQDYETEEEELGEEEEYKLAPLMSSRSHFNLETSSRHIFRHFNEVLQERGRGDMSPEELELVKNVLKSDERYRCVDKNNPELFKDILKDQLKDILKHEHVVKQALHKLESKESLYPDVHNKEHLEESQICTPCPEEPKKLEVDVVFKNVPSLEREILILRALGEKLESTLNRTNSQRNIVKYQDIKDTENRIKENLNSNIPPIILQIKPYGYVRGPEHNASIVLAPLGIRLIIGIAMEFYIAQKSIVEMKNDANQSFFMPLDSKNPEMKKTSFMKLKENPNIFIKYIKSKDPAVSFNLLDHDPIFFNNILKNNKTTSDITIDKDQEEISNAELQDSFTTFTPGEKLNEGNEKILEVVNLQQRPLMRVRQRRRIRKSVTPLLVDKPDPNPKNHLLKTILVGVVQISCFMLLIMAFTLPDAKC